METTFYFVRHAQPNYENHDDAARELTAKGWRDRELVTRFLADKHIGVVLSSPYRRAVETVAPFARRQGLAVVPVDGFRERTVGPEWIADFTAFSKRQWADFSYRRGGGESLGDVQARNLAALYAALERYGGSNIVVGSHGTALSTLVHHFDASFGYDSFVKIKDLMPWIVKFEFDGAALKDMEFFDLFA